MMRRWREWLLAFDPGLTRLRLAGRATLTVALALGVLTLLTRATGQPLTVVLLGAVIALLASMAVNDPEPRAQRVTTLLMPVAAAAAITIGTLASSSRVAGDAGFVVIVFAAVYVRRFGPRGFALGMLGFITYFFALFLHAGFSTLPWLLAALAIGTACAYLMRFVIFPDRPQRELRRTLQAVYADIGQMLDTIIDAISDGDWSARQRRELRRRGGRLGAAVLAAENQLENAAKVRLPADLTGNDLMLRLFDLGLAAERVAGAARAAEPAALASRLDQLRELRRRLYAVGAPAASDPPTGDDGRLGFALRDLDSALTAMPASGMIRITQHSKGGEGTDESPPDQDQSTREQKGLRPTSRQAIQVAVASALAIMAGELLSPVRWYWAAITAFVVFTGTNSRGETVSKGWQRVLDTLAGVIAGVFIATAVAGDTNLSLALIFVCIFLGFYLIRVAYGLMIFWVTILLALLYGLLGRFTPGLLVLRLEETALGAAIGILVAVFVLPASTRGAVREAVWNYLGALGELIEISVDRIANQNSAADPTARARALDRQLQQLQDTAKPLSQGFAGALNRKGIRRSLRTLVAASYYARNLARLSQQVGPVAEPVSDALTQAGHRIGNNLATMAAERNDAAVEESAADLLDQAEAQAQSGDPPNPRLLAAIHFLDRLDQLVIDLTRLKKHPEGDTGCSRW